MLIKLKKDNMINKIVAWVTLIITIVALIGWMTNPYQDSWFFVLIYFVVNTYIIIKYIETL